MTPPTNQWLRQVRIDVFLYKQPVYKQPGLRFFENNNKIQWSIVMLNNGEQ